MERVAPFCTARILASDATGDLPYIVSEYVDGPSLQRVIGEGRTFTEADLARLAIGTATALAAIHEAGVVHRDFKPGNVLLGPGGPRVIDFGIARPLDATAATMSGAIGTPSYMAPEQLAGAPAGPPLDLFAWGCTIAAAANGLPPFGNDSILAGGIATAVLVIGATTAFVLNGVLNDRDRSGRGAERAGSSPSTAPSGPCTYLPPASDAQSVQRNSGTPPPRPELTGTVRASVTTSRGVIAMDLDATKAPCTVNSFAYLAKRAYDGNYTVFGKVVSGLKVVDDLAEHGTDDSESPGSGHPKRKITIQRVTLTPRS